MKKVLNVGQCQTDHWAIRQLLERNFNAQVAEVDDARQTLDLLRGEPFDLVLVNRRLDGDGSDGLEIIKAIKADPALRSTSVMLVTNYPEYQEQAIAAGAEPGFGKSELRAPETVQRLKPFLG